MRNEGVQNQNAEDCQLRCRISVFIQKKENVSSYLQQRPMDIVDHALYDHSQQSPRHYQ